MRPRICPHLMVNALGDRATPDHSISCIYLPHLQAWSLGAYVEGLTSRTCLSLGRLRLCDMGISLVTAAVSLSCAAFAWLLLRRPNDLPPGPPGHWLWGNEFPKSKCVVPFIA